MATPEEGSEIEHKDQFLSKNHAPDPESSLSVRDVIERISSDRMNLPTRSSPVTDPTRWRSLIDSTEPYVYTELAEEMNQKRYADFFKTLSYRCDPESEYTVDEIVDINSGAAPDRNERRERAKTALRYAYDYLPPVTAGYVGSFLSRVNIYDKEHYKNQILPEGVEWAGIHHSHKREIDVSYTEYFLSSPFDKCPKEGERKSSVLIHEIGHAVHTCYGLHRPKDFSYEYPDDAETMDHSGIVGGFYPSEHQANFVMSVIEAYVMHHKKQEGRDVKLRGYERTHPAETFASCFERAMFAGSDFFSDRIYLARPLELLL